MCRSERVLSGKAFTSRRQRCPERLPKNEQDGAFASGVCCLGCSRCVLVSFCFYASLLLFVLRCAAFVRCLVRSFVRLFLGSFVVLYEKQKRRRWKNQQQTKKTRKPKNLNDLAIRDRLEVVAWLFAAVAAVVVAVLLLPWSSPLDWGFFFTVSLFPTLSLPFPFCPSLLPRVYSVSCVCVCVSHCVCMQAHVSLRLHPSHAGT